MGQFVKTAAMIMAADSVAAEDAAISGMQKQAFSVGKSLSALGGHIGRNASALAHSRAGLPIVGGLAGGAISLPMALADLKEGDTLEGLGTLALGTGAGVGAGFLGRGLLRTRGHLQDALGKAKANAQAHMAEMRAHNLTRGQLSTANKDVGILQRIKTDYYNRLRRVSRALQQMEGNNVAIQRTGILNKVRPAML